VLPALRARAEQGSWSDELQWRLDAVAGGGSAVVACRELGLLGEPGERGEAYRDAGEPGSPGAHLPGLAEVVLTGQYGCPDGRCARRDQRDQRGRPPLCDLAGIPMRFHADR